MFGIGGRYNYYEENTRKNRKINSGNFITSLITSLIVGALLLILIWNNIIPIPPRNDSVSPGVDSGQKEIDPDIPQDIRVPNPQQIGATISNPTDNIVNVTKSVIDGVVGISVLRANVDSIFDSNTTEKWGVGTGVVVSSDGYILTNHHVAGGKNKKLIVFFSDGTTMDGQTLWSDSVLDLAIVKVNATGLTAIPLGDASKLQVGELAIAIGNPFGLQLQRTVTSGIISALNRTISIDTEQGTNYMEGLIQTDASINPGNSGGPLLNFRGEVVGINTVKIASAEGIGFAIPINVAIPIIQKFKDTGTFKEAYMGIFAYDREAIPFLEQDLKLDNGIYVVKVDQDGPAAKSGIKKGCIILEVDGKPVNTMLELRCIIYSKNPGDVINITHIERETGKIVTTPITLSEKKGDGLITR